MLERFGLNPTQLVGLISFAGASAACFWAGRQRKGARNRSIWGRLSVIYGLLFVEMILGVRHKAHDFANALLKASGEYASRAGPQGALIIMLCFITIAALACIPRHRRKLAPAPRQALGITIALLGMFAIEMISIHAFDAILYMPIGPVLLIGWLWAAAALAIVLTASRR